MGKPVDIKHPRRILILGETREHTEHISRVLTESASKATDEAVSEADRDVPVHKIKTPYYDASVPVWRDEIPSPEAWAAQWRGEEGAGDVVRAIGAWVVCFTKPTDRAAKDSLREMLSIISRTIHHHLNSASSAFALDYLDVSDIVTLAVAIPPPGHRVSNSNPAVASDLSTPQSNEAEAELEELCQTATGIIGTGLGWEYVDGTVPLASGRLNEFGERMGLDRLVEALKGGEWDAGGADDDGELGDGDDDAADENFGFEKLDDDDEEGEDVDDASTRDDGFGSFATATPQPLQGSTGDGLALEDDDFTNEMAAGFGEVSAPGLSSRDPFDVEAELQEERDRALGEEMRKSLLGNAQGIGTADEGGSDPVSTSGTHGAVGGSGKADDDDPWRVRGKGRPSGPHAPTRSRQTDLDPLADFPIDRDDGDDDGDEVELLQSMMMKLQAARDLGADLPPAQRRQMAAKAVREVMREI